jgi:hypothetical protein
MVKINPENIKVEVGLFFVVDAFPETNASHNPHQIPRLLGCGLR